MSALVFDDVWIIVCVTSLQAGQLGLERDQLLLESGRIVAGLRGLPGGNLLAQQSLRKTLVLLRTGQSLSRGIQLRSEPRKKIQIGLLFVGKGSPM